MKSLSFLAACFVCALTGAHASLTSYDLRCDGGVDPLGIDSAPPRLSWKLRADNPAARGQRQTAWQVLVASSRETLAADRGDIWDSGRVANDEQLHVPYAGRTLRSSEQVFWKLRVWDVTGTASSWSAPATWTMGLVDAADWGDARWITAPQLKAWNRTKLGYRSEPATHPDTTKWIQLDLGSPQPIEAVRFHGVRFMVAENLGFLMRYQLEAALAEDFADAVVIAHQAEDRNPWPTRIEHRVENSPLTVRYLRLTATRLRTVNGETCLALAQIVVLSGGKNIAAGAKVTASDSVENELWSRDAVADGIGEPGVNPHANQTLLLRREFTVRPGLRRALLHVSGLGHYELAANGARVGDGLLKPGWTDYAKTILYDTHDLTARLRPGANALGLTLAGGMYNVQSGRYVKFVTPFRPLTARALLRLEYDDGSVVTLATDEQWRTAFGPITFANVFGGEDHDARLEPRGWDQPGFDAATAPALAWQPAVLHTGPGGTLRGYSHASPPFRAHETFTPAATRELRPGVTVYDFGQNAAIMLRLRVRGPAGAVVKLIPAELVRADGSVERGSSGGNEVWWQYTLRGDPAGETWEPRFFYHGSRYVQAELSAAQNTLPTIEQIETYVAHSDSPPAGDFACSNDLFNRIRTLIRWAQRSNLAHYLTDCPHRERLSWLEQYHLNGPAVRYETDVARLFRKTFADMADAQTADGLVSNIAPQYVIFNDGFRDSPEWGSAVILAAWQHYGWTGDDTPLRRNYDVMQRYVAYLASRAEGDIVSHGLGDWYDLGPNRPGFAQLTPVPLTATAIYYEAVRTMAPIAAHLGHDADARRYTTDARRIGASFNRTFQNPAFLHYASNSQTANALPLALGLVPPAQRAAVLDALVADIERRGNAITAGDVGYRYVLRALADSGRSDVIFAMNNQSEKPGYGFQLARGATSLTEAWDANRNSSQNHFMLGQLTEWLFGDLAGLAPDPAAPGFKHVLIRPQPVGDITWARASHESPRGKISVAWTIEGGAFSLDVDLPPGVTATVEWPAQTGGPAGGLSSLRESGRPITEANGVRMAERQMAFNLLAGQYRFTTPR